MENFVRQLTCRKFDAEKPKEVIAKEIDINYGTVASIILIVYKEQENRNKCKKL